MMSTYTGRLLRVNLNETKNSVEEIPEQVQRDFLDPRGFAIKYLYEELGGGVQALSPENKLVLGAGVLGATTGQGFSKWVVVL
jgi:aldehyde:ferredoxin oxidoreductase